MAGGKPHGDQRGRMNEEPDVPPVGWEEIQKPDDQTTEGLMAQGYKIHMDNVADPEAARYWIRQETVEA